VAGFLSAPACSAEPGAAKDVSPNRPTCSAVDAAHIKEREAIGRRVDGIRGELNKHGPGQKSELEENAMFGKLMADIERVEGRYRIQSKNCVKD
jgi:hypothetical protein